MHQSKRQKKKNIQEDDEMRGQTCRQEHTAILQVVIAGTRKFNASIKPLSCTQ